MNIKNGKLWQENKGFIFIDTLVIIPVLCFVIVSLMVITKAFINNSIAYINNWIMQTETRRVFEDMIMEIEYADEIKYKKSNTTNRELIITTRRRATANPNETVKYFSYTKQGPIIYRNELSKLNDDMYIVRASQPLNSENYLGDNKITFDLNKIDENFYWLEMEGYSYKTNQYIHFKSAILRRFGD